jgi:hypothetical protein
MPVSAVRVWRYSPCGGYEVRENWKDFRFWAWWWRNRVATEAKLGIGALVGALLIVGGYFASSSLTGADAASTGGQSYILQTTVTRVVTVREHGKTLVKRIPVVVRRSVIRSKTAYQTLVDTRYVTTPGAVRYETRKVVRYVPVVKRKVVHVNGKTTTLTQTRLLPTVKTQTLTNVVTNQQTVTNQSTVVVNHTDTVVRPVTTVVTKTITLPPDTVTQTQTQTETQTVTVTQTETQTVTAPGVTITVGLP